MPKILEGRRIMVVEDDFLIAMEVQDLLTELGAEVVGPFGRLTPAVDAASASSCTGPFSTCSSRARRSKRSPSCSLPRGPGAARHRLREGAAGAVAPAPPRVRKPYNEKELRGVLERAYR